MALSERSYPSSRNGAMVTLKERRPLIIAGGPKSVYEPWDVFSVAPFDPWGADE